MCDLQQRFWREDEGVRPMGEGARDVLVLVVESTYWGLVQCLSSSPRLTYCLVFGSHVRADEVMICSSADQWWAYSYCYRS